MSFDKNFNTYSFPQGNGYGDGGYNYNPNSAPPRNGTYNYPPDYYYRYATQDPNGFNGSGHFEDVNVHYPPRDGVPYQRNQFQHNNNIPYPSAYVEGLSEDEQLALALSLSLGSMNLQNAPFQSSEKTNRGPYTNPFSNKPRNFNSEPKERFPPQPPMNFYSESRFPPPPPMNFYSQQRFPPAPPMNFPSEHRSPPPAMNSDPEPKQRSTPPPYERTTRTPPMSRNSSARRSGINLPGNTPREYQVLLLGGTGTGKSTIINTLANYFLGGTLDDLKIVIPTKYLKVTETAYAHKHSEASINDVTKSQTTKCYTYTFKHPQNPAYRFHLIDTPGLSDTNGTKQDDKNIDEIIGAAINAGSLAAIVIIVNGTEARVTNSIKNTLVRLANNLPDVLIDSNLLLILTKCSKGSACFSPEGFAREIAKPKEIFYMDNQAFSSDPRIWQNDEDEHCTIKFHWDKSNRTIDSILETITELSTTSTDAFKTMKGLRDKIKSEISQITQDISNIQKVQDSLDAAQRALQKTGDQKNSFANYTTSTTMTLKKIKPANYHSTVCTTHLRNDIICHDNCGLEFKTSSGTDHFKYCSCMGSNDTCTKCGCGPTSHFHDKVKLVTETNTVSNILHDMKAQYDMADQQHRRISNDANNYQATLANLQAAADGKYKQIEKLCIDLSKVCSRFNFVDELHANIENMRQDARTLQNATMRKKAEDEIRKLEKLATDLSTKCR